MTNNNPPPTPALTLSDKLMAMNHLTTFVPEKLDVDAMNHSSLTVEGVDVDETFKSRLLSRTFRTVLSLAFHDIGLFISLMSRMLYYMTPVDTESKLGDGSTPVVDPTLYRSLAGSLQYLTFTRPDITYAVQQVLSNKHDHREPHFSALKRILRFVQGTLDYGLQLFSSTSDSLIAFSDADWAGFPTTRRSTSGYCVFLSNNLLSWSSKRQPTLFPRSTARLSI
ncbi:ribonuclease H-like domain-containing protein [Tanacetum coccineum]